MRSTWLFIWVLLSALCAAAEILVPTRSGGTASLKCGISDSTSVLKWLRGNEPVYTSNPRTGMPLRGKGEIVKKCRLKYERVLEISQVAREDAGLFTCKVNDKEEQHRLLVTAVSVAPSGPLEAGSRAELHCDVSGLGGGSSVRWRGPDGRSYDEATVTLSHVTTNDSGSWTCEISSSGGTIDSVQMQIREPRRKTTPGPLTTGMTLNNKTTCLNCETSTESTAPPLILGLSWWVWAAMGGGCLLVLLWVLILIMYNQIHRRKRRFMKMQTAALLKEKQYCQCPGPTAAKSHCRTKASAPPLTLI